MHYSALLFLDLDNFKHINDSLGHHAGDNVLLETALLLKKNLRESDIVSRFGGDEFIILIDTFEKNYNNAQKKLSIVANNILFSLKRINTKYYTNYKLSSSIGITLFNDDKISTNQLIIQADSAMYKAKAKGGNCFDFFLQQNN